MNYIITEIDIIFVIKIEFSTFTFHAVISEILNIFIFIDCISVFEFIFFFSGRIFTSDGFLTGKASDLCTLFKVPRFNVRSEETIIQRKFFLIDFEIVLKKIFIMIYREARSIQTGLGLKIYLYLFLYSSELLKM